MFLPCRVMRKKYPSPPPPFPCNLLPGRLLPAAEGKHKFWTDASVCLGPDQGALGRAPTSHSRSPLEEQNIIYLSLFWEMGRKWIHYSTKPERDCTIRLINFLWLHHHFYPGSRSEGWGKVVIQVTMASNICFCISLCYFSVTSKNSAFVLQFSNFQSQLQRMVDFFCNEIGFPYKWKLTSY